MVAVSNHQLGGTSIGGEGWVPRSTTRVMVIAARPWERVPGPDSNGGYPVWPQGHNGVRGQDDEVWREQQYT
jgi:hypothetical protein